MVFLVDTERRAVGRQDREGRAGRRHAGAVGAPARPRRTAQNGAAQLNWSRRHRQRRRDGVPRAPLHHLGLHAVGGQPGGHGLERHQLHRHRRSRPGTYYYRVVAADAAGNAGAPSASDQRGGDQRHRRRRPCRSRRRPPTPLLAGTGRGHRQRLRQRRRSQSVQFRVDGTNVGAADTSSPYSLSLNTTTLTNGTHTLSAVARDAAGNTGTSANVTVTVDNAAPTAPASLTARGRDQRGAAQLGRVHRQPGRDRVPRASRHDHGLHALGGQPRGDRGERHELLRHRPDAGHLLLPRDRGGRGRATPAPRRPQATAVVTADTTAPNVAISAPAAAASVAGTISVTATATDNVAVQNVQFRVDGANVGAADTSSPYCAVAEHHDAHERHPHAERRGPRRRGQHAHLGERDGHRGQRASDRVAHGSRRGRPRGRHDLPHRDGHRQRRRSGRAVPG